MRIEALAGFDTIDTYESTRIAPTRNEGARLEVDHAFLNDLAGRTGGAYSPETEIDRLIERLRASLLTGSVETDVHLVQQYGLFFLVVLAVLAWEWDVRRALTCFEHAAQASVFSIYCIAHIHTPHPTFGGFAMQWFIFRRLPCRSGNFLAA